MKQVTLPWSVPVVVALCLTACATGPLPIVIHEDRSLSVWLKFDPASGSGHRHPVDIPEDRLGTVLSGLRIVPRHVIGGLFGIDKEGDPVFVPAEVSRLAPILSQALRKASPRDMVTFYQVGGDRSTGALITSGGMVFRNGYLYVILANAKTSPSTKLYETGHEVDTRDDPVLPLARFNFSVGFSPETALVPKGLAKDSEATDRYLDPAKVVVIDLSKLPGPQGRRPPGPALPSAGR
jgi:hypothetical protein